MNLMKCVEDAKNDITSGTNKEETNIECDTIGGKKWKRVCPICEKELLYSCFTTCRRQNKKNGVCKKCSQLYKKLTGPFKRNCPACNKELVYENKRTRDRAVKKNRNCLSCSISIKNTNRILSNKTLSVLRDICNKNSSNKIGKVSWNKGSKHTDETKQKIRIGIINHIRKNGINAPRYNINACKYFDEINKQNKWNLQHALNGGEVEVCGYFVDSYDKNKNIVVEYDEPKHYNVNGELKKKDIDRMVEICNHLKCEFWRYNEKKGTLQKYEY